MPELLITFLDVGQGDSTVVVLPDGGGVLVDSAAGSAPLVVDYLERAQVNSLELVVITHSDLDHAGDVIEVINGFQGPIRRIAVLPDRVLKTDPQANRKYRVMLRELAQLLRNGVTYWEPYAGQMIQLGDIVVSALHPSQADHFDALSQGNQNDCSVTLRLEYSGARILLGADVQRQGWQWMVDRNTDLKADIFKFPHHGAWYDGDPSLSQVLELVDPSVVVISVGSKNGYGHPSIETLRLLRSLQTRVRFVCTQATNQCHGELEAAATHVRVLLPPDSSGGNSLQARQSCPCAGNVTVRISSNGVAISPTPEEHSRVIELFEKPQCREEAFNPSGI